MLSKAVISLSLLPVLSLLAIVSAGREKPSSGEKVTLDSNTKLELSNADAKWADYRGRHALHLVPLPGHEKAQNEELMAVLPHSDFKNGTIELDVSGARRTGYSTAEDISGFKGMIGVAFHVDGEKREVFYVRPENSRLENQLFRNRSTQYESLPDFPWTRLREENPGEYESYVDLESGAWTKLRIEVSDVKARLYINNAAQPCLVVNDLKLGEGHVKLALWTLVITEAYFSNLRVDPAP
jgi:hypothetical protein